ncbi:MAG: cytochrome c oxidase subunit II [Phycisphaerales bacterium]|nr:cytochrome c oxidase subunit II [Phycisphaerales bacterium]
MRRAFVASGWMMSLLAATASGAAPVCAPGTAEMPSMFLPRSEPAEIILDITWLIIGICAVIFIVMEGLIVWAIIRYRKKRSESEGGEPPQVYGSNPVELAWTVIPLLIVFVLFLVSARGIFEIDKQEPPPGSLEVTVVGHRWWWEFDYGDLGFVTANELHIPLTKDGEPQSVYLMLESADVIHSFWVPQLAGKMDVVPGRINHLWLQPSRAGKYIGQCAEYCGNQHANMLITVYVHTEEEFARWVENQQKEAVEDAAVAEGRDLFMSTACINCHTIRGTVADGTFAPDLTHLMSRSVLGAGAAANTPDRLREWVWDPQNIKPGCDMPSMKLSREETDRICDYLETLK